MSRAPASIEVRTSRGSYAVTIGDGVALDAPRMRAITARFAGGIALVTDSNVDAVHGASVRAALGDDSFVGRHVIEPGERSKRPETWAAIARDLIRSGLGRDGLVVALGGGVVSDLAGFVAASLHRGTAWLAIPTTLLAQVDASIGGKTGIDVPEGKNLLGAIHPPCAVLVDPALLATLPRAEWINGLGEVLKSAILSGEAEFAEIERAPAPPWTDRKQLAEVVRSCVALKARLCSEDEDDRGVRRLLNLGHTIGHAIEAASDFSLPHGAAVALGTLAEARLAHRLGLAQESLASRIAAAARRLGLPTCADPALLARSLAFLDADKKRVARRAVFALPAAIGTARVVEVTDALAVRAAVESLAFGA